jgi:feruloyl esterase
MWTMLAAAAAVPLAAGDCAGLAKLALPTTTITVAEEVTAGTFQPAGGKGLTNLPAFCRVAGVIKPSSDSGIRFEVWLPAQGWNSKFQGVGNGGFAGAISYGGLADAVRNGYAAASTDTGHQADGTDGTWALGHPEKLIDYGYRAIHEMTVKGKALAEAYYGTKPRRSYFSSCSNGGRQALMEAQRYPDDYDGIISGAPAHNFTHLTALFVSIMQATAGNPAGYIPQSKLAAIQAAALTACDRLDGVTDGVVENPGECRFDPATLLCQGAESDTCLTGPQVESVKRIYGGLRDSKGKLLYPGFAMSGEAEPGGWGPWITGPAPEKSAMFAFGTGVFKYMVHGNPDWDYRKFSVDKDLKAVVAKTSHILDATNPDLRRFEARGGKLILYHGWCDAAIPAQAAIDYYKSVQKKMGAKRSAGFVRLFLAPGVQHCGGGAGPNTFGQGGVARGDAGSNIAAALERWVEQGISPEQIVASRGSGAGARTRPLCAYPKVARYKGTGNTDTAESFECAAAAPH